MVTHSNKIAELKAKYPTIKTGDDLAGYVELTSEEYEAKIAEWAAAEIAKETAEAEALAKAEAEAAAVLLAKAEAEAKLSALGLTVDDLKALLS